MPFRVNNQAANAVSCFLVSLFLSCSSPSTSGPTCEPTKKLDLYVGNISATDTLVPARVVLDDSVLVNQLVLTSHVSQSTPTALLRICPGKHRIQVQFGQFSKDTLLAIAGDQSLFVSFDYESYEGAVNGIAVALLDHDHN